MTNTTNQKPNTASDTTNTKEQNEPKPPKKKKKSLRMNIGGMQNDFHTVNIH